jgi:hypothetical protein
MPPETDTQTQPTATPPVTEIPSLFEADGTTLRNLKPRDFPRTRDGRKAFFNYRAMVFDKIAGDFRQRAQDIDKAEDPVFLKRRKAERMKALLAKLEAELAATP